MKIKRKFHAVLDWVEEEHLPGAGFVTSNRADEELSADALRLVINEAFAGLIVGEIEVRVTISRSRVQTRKTVSE